MYDAKQHDAQQYAAAPREFAFRASNRRDWQEWQNAFYPRLRSILGLDTMQQDLADHVPTSELREEEDMGTYIRESRVLWVEPTVPLPFWLLRPKEMQSPAPLILTPHGHNAPELYVGIAKNEAEKASIRDGERDIAVQAVQQGYVAIAPTTRGFGETRTTDDIEKGALHSCRTELLHGLLVGRTAIGKRVWDISRLIDWASQRPDIDTSKIAITGNSGGGTTSLHAAACDRRINVAVPSCYFCTYEGSIGSIFHCDCNYIPGILRLGEMYDVAGLVAPRPFCAIAGQHDTIFPIQHVRTAFEQLKKIYAAAGVPERCDLYVGSEGHRFYADGAWPFINRFLK